jgi:hypothetical protein
MVENLVNAGGCPPAPPVVMGQKSQVVILTYLGPKRPF